MLSDLMNNGVLTDIKEKTYLNSLIISQVLKLTKHERNTDVKEVLFEMNNALEDILSHLLQTVAETHKQYLPLLQTITRDNYPFIELKRVIENNQQIKTLFTSSEIGLYGDIKTVMNLYDERCEYLSKVTPEEEILSNVIELKQSNNTQ